MKIVLRSGKPEDIREDRESAVYTLLDSLGIEYLRADHAQADTMEDCREISAVLGASVCKNLFLCNRQKTSFYLLMMPEDKPFKTKELSAQIGSARLSFAGEESMLNYLNILPGSVSVMGLMNDRELKVSLLIDRDLLSREYQGVHPCKNTSTLRIKTSDLINIFLPAVKHGFNEVTLVGREL